MYIIKRSLELKLPTIWRDEKQNRKAAKTRVEERKRNSQSKEDTDARNVRKVAKRCVFPMI